LILYFLAYSHSIRLKVYFWSFIVFTLFCPCRKKFNIPDDEDEKIGEDDLVDYHQFYERVQASHQSGSASSGGEQEPMCSVTYTTASVGEYGDGMSMTDMKPSDVLSLAASTTILSDSYAAGRLAMDTLVVGQGPSDPLTDAESLGYSHGYERIATTPFDQL